MKKRNTFTKLITITMALTAMALIRSTWATGQTETQDNLTQIHLGCIGFVEGETLRLSAFNPNEPEQGSEPVLAQVRLYDPEGGSVLIYSGESGGTGEIAMVELPPGQFCTLDFNRAHLMAAGEAGTGRLQVRVEIVYRYTDNSGQIPPENFTVSTEIFDNRTGKTKGYQTGSVGWVKVSPDA